MVIPNSTHYFNEFTRAYNCVPDSNSFSFQSSKRQGYFQRLYYEFLYTNKIGGQTFFYTLTYNNKSIPKFLNYNVFSYDDIRYVTNGKLSKVLLRKHGSRLKYFCACESGEGKGIRGVGYNPHYHFIFFVQPKHDNDNKPIYDGYNPILPDDFRKLIYEIWQGSCHYIPFQKAKFGIAREGRNCGVVFSPDAFKYVSKYCLKENEWLEFETKVSRYYYNECKSKGIDYSVLYDYYYYLRRNSAFTRHQFIDEFNLRQFNRLRKQGNVTLDVWLKYSVDSEVSSALYEWFNDVYVPAYASYYLNEFKRLHSPKVRCSKSLGAFGLENISYVVGVPKFFIPRKDGYSIQNVALYYYRHLYYDVYVCPVTGNPLYRLNSAGIEHLVNTLPQRINNYSERVLQVLRTLSIDSSYHVDNTFVTDLLQMDNLNWFLRLYSVYHFVYQYRSYLFNVFNPRIDSNLFYYDIESDYNEFLKYSIFFLDYDDNKCYLVRQNYDYAVLSFDNHPVFQPYVDKMNKLDELLSIYDACISEQSKQDFERKSSHLKRLKAYINNLQLLS